MAHLVWAGGARLPVYVLFAAAFFPSNGQNLVFALYLVGIAMAVITGLVMKHSLLSGESSGFLMELQNHHRPTVRGVLLRTWDRVRLFIRDAGRVIVVMVLALNLLNGIGTDGSIGNENSENSVLSAVGKSLQLKCAQLASSSSVNPSFRIAASSRFPTSGSGLATMSSGTRRMRMT